MQLLHHTCYAAKRDARLLTWRLNSRRLSRLFLPRDILGRKKKARRCESTEKLFLGGLAFGIMVC